MSEYEEELVALLLPLLPTDADHSMSYAKHAEAVEVFCQATLGICSESDRDLLGVSLCVCVLCLCVCVPACLRACLCFCLCVRARLYVRLCVRL